jgi:hypothetical protein
MVEEETDASVGDQRRRDEGRSHWESRVEEVAHGVLEGSGRWSVGDQGSR